MHHEVPVLLVLKTVTQMSDEHLSVFFFFFFFLCVCKIIVLKIY